MDNEYTIASTLAKRILEVQLYFWNQTWSNNPDFIKYCQLVRSNLYRSIYSENKFEEIQSILKLKNKHFLINRFYITRNAWLDLNVVSLSSRSMYSVV